MLLKEKSKSLRMANDRIFWVMRSPWARVVRIAKIIKIIFNFSKNPGIFFLESSSIPEVVDGGGGGGGGDPPISPTCSVKSFPRSFSGAVKC